MGRLLIGIAGDAKDVKQFLESPGSLKVIKFSGRMKSGMQRIKVIGEV